MDSKNRLAFLAAFVLLGIVGRLAFTGTNFTPVGALALFAGAAVWDKRIAFILPLVIMLVTDAMIGFHSTVLFVYVGMCIYAALGLWVGPRTSPLRIVSASLAGSIAFFIVTNVGAYFAFYPQTSAGLVECFVSALPFFRYTLASDLFFGSLLFGAYAAARQYLPELRATAS